jgi:aldose 1-epimerase
MTGAAWLPPGQLHTLRAGPLTLRVAPAAGGRLASLTSTDASGRATDWLVPMPPDSLRDGFGGHAWPKAGCYPLVPFSNRIRNGRFSWDGRDVVLAPHTGQAHAMHGLGHVRAWDVASQTIDRITLTLRHRPHHPVSSDWPWPFFAMQTLRLTSQGLGAQLLLRNDGTTTMPAGGGFHPFIARRPGARLGFDASFMWPADQGGVATHREPVGERESFREGRPLPQTGCSVYYSGWTRQARLSCPDGSGLALRVGAGLDHLILHAPADCGYVCLEPVSHVADAVNLAARGHAGTGLRALAPGQAMRWRMLLRIDPPG